MGQKPLHDILCEIIGEDRCYFEPPSNIQMKYPCIIYHSLNGQDTFADNIHYLKFKRYSVTVIDEDPDSKIPEKLEELTYCSSDRDYCYEGLWHFSYTLFFNGERIRDEE